MEKCACRDFNSVRKFFAEKIGYDVFEKGAEQALSDYCNSLGIYHTSETVTCYANDGSTYERVVAYVNDVKQFRIAAGKDPDAEFVVSCDKGQGKVIIIMQDDDGEVYLLAVLDDADENQPNIDMMLTKLKFPFKGRF